MGLDIKRNKKGLYKITSTISDESYHPDKKWITEEEAKKCLIEDAFYNFILKAIEIDMTFPQNYINEEGTSAYYEWFIGSFKEKKHSEILSEKIKEVIQKLNIDLTL